MDRGKPGEGAPPADGEAANPDAPRDLHVRTHDGRALDAALCGWDPATSLAVAARPRLRRCAGASRTRALARIRNRDRETTLFWETLDIKGRKLLRFVTPEERWHSDVVTTHAGNPQKCTCDMATSVGYCAPFRASFLYRDTALGTPGRTPTFATVIGSLSSPNLSPRHVFSMAGSGAARENYD